MPSRKKQLEVELKRIRKSLIKGYKPKKIILFGSLAAGRAGKNSDIDLVVIKDSKKRFIDRIGDVIDLTRPRISTDFIVYTSGEFEMLSKSESFVRDEIIENGKVIYEAS